jgi:hypothetical protein
MSSPMIGKEYYVKFLTMSFYLSFIRENRGATHCRAHPRSAFLFQPYGGHHHSAVA